ncbi:hypothetical protein D9M71_602310 [compost metagenome]
MSFKGDMDAATRRIIEAHDKIARTAALDLFSGTIKDTPVLDGRLRGDWTTQVDSEASAENGRVDKTGQLAIAEAAATIPDKAGHVVTMTNNMPYAYRVEFEGWSKKAPEGMMRRNLARVQRIVQQAIAKFRV